MNLASLAITLGLVASSLAASPPSTIGLVAPISIAVTNASFVYGVTPTVEGQVIEGVQGLYSVQIQLPNGTMTSLVDLYNNVRDEGNCDLDSTSITQQFNSTSQEGNYTIFWNVTYGISSDPSKANSTSCGPGPMTYQSWVLNYTIPLQHGGQGSTSPYTTMTTTLPSQPTGSVTQLKGSQVRSYIISPLVIMGSGVLGTFFL